MTDRRDFLRTLAALAGTAGITDWPSRPLHAQPPRPVPSAATTPFLAGIQMGAHTILDEGIEPCLDLLRDTAAIDTLMTYSHAYGGDVYPGVGFNLPGGGPDDPEVIYQCVKRSFDAGAGGVVASREYEEMTVPNLKGFGRGVREAAASRGFRLEVLQAESPSGGRSFRRKLNSHV